MGNGLSQDDIFHALLGTHAGSQKFAAGNADLHLQGDGLARRGNILELEHGAQHTQGSAHRRGRLAPIALVREINQGGIAGELEQRAARPGQDFQHGGEIAVHDRGQAFGAFRPQASQAFRQGGKTADIREQQGAFEHLAADQPGYRAALLFFHQVGRDKGRNLELHRAHPVEGVDQDAAGRFFTLQLAPQFGRQVFFQFGRNGKLVWRRLWRAGLAGGDGRSSSGHNRPARLRRLESSTHLK